jgi:hypothetical protein
MIIKLDSSLLGQDSLPVVSVGSSVLNIESKWY